MNRTLVGTLGVVMVSATLVVAKPISSQSKPAEQDKNTVTYIGCLGAGSDEEHFSLTDAKIKGKAPADIPDKGNFHVVAASKKVALETHLTQQVEITGTLSKEQPPALGTSRTPVLRTLTATSVKWRADYCGLPF